MSEVSPRGGREGAATGEVAGLSVVVHYGDPGAEYRAIREGAGIVDRSDLAVFRVWGRDPVRMINGLITNDLGLAAGGGRAVYAAMLTPKGRIISDVRVLALPSEEGVELLLEIPANAAAAVEAHLRRYLPPLFARWERSTLRVLGIYGPSSGRLLEATLAAAPPSSEYGQSVGAFQGDRVPIVATRAAGGEIGFDVFLPEQSFADAWETLLAAGGVPAGFDAFETLRIEAGRPRYGLDMTEETFPAEAFQTTGLMDDAVSFTKGCYTGQEVVVRIAHRGHVNRHVRGLLLGDARPPSGTMSVFEAGAEGKKVGAITSATVSPLLGQTIALAVLRREVEVGATVRVGEEPGVPAVVSTLPFEAAGG